MSNHLCNCFCTVRCVYGFYSGWNKPRLIAALQNFEQIESYGPAKLVAGDNSCRRHTKFCKVTKVLTKDKETKRQILKALFGSSVRIAMKPQAKLSPTKAASLTRVRSSRLSTGLTSITEEPEASTTDVQLPPRIRCQYDVIWSFLDEFLDMIIQDYQVLESKPPEPEYLSHLRSSENIYVKDFQDISEQDLESAEVMSVNGANVVLKQKNGRAMSLDATPKGSSHKVPFKIGSRSLDDVLKSKKSLEKKSSSSRSIQISSNRSSTTAFSEGEIKNVRITFMNGNVYEGQAVHNRMCGQGQFLWADGTFYEGEFKDGLPNGQGDMILPDLSRYTGGFRNGLYHGEGVLKVAYTKMIYSGGWRDGKKHGQGWLLYGPNNWYDGGWYEDKKHGLGLRRYENGARYKGYHHMGKRHGQGFMVWKNNDCYKGEWENDKFEGYGEYIWRAFFNQAFVFPLHNVYKGQWVDGERSGEGVMYFGNGAKLEGTFAKNLKHGDCVIYSGNRRPTLQTFGHDKLVHNISASNGSPAKGVPIFSIPENVNVSHYIDEILDFVLDNVKVPSTSLHSLQHLRRFEETAVKNTIALHLPQLKELYETYAMLYAGDEPVNFKPVMVRMILWQLYKDIEVPTTLGMSILDTDKILSENPDSCVESEHYPFEHILFWQFLMSLVGLAFKTKNLNDLVEDEEEGSVLASVLKHFFHEKLFAKLPPKKESPSFKYKNLIPIKNVYQLYQSLGNPPTALTFLRKTCLRRGQESMWDCLEHDLNKKVHAGKHGANTVPIYEKISFKNLPHLTFPEDENENSVMKDDSWQNLIEFRHLGIRSIFKCLLEACPAIMEEGVLNNIEYPISFLEFYDCLLYCIFLVIERELAWAKKQIPEVEMLPKVKPEQKDTTKKKGKGKKK